MSDPGGWVRGTIKVIAIAAAGVAVGLAVRARAPDAGAAPQAVPEEATVEVVNGTLSSASLTQLTGGSRSHDSLVIVLVAEKDCLTCEDLGRQIRHLVESVSDPRMVILASPVGDSARVSRFARIERLGLSVTYLGAAVSLDDGSIVPTPAALVIDRTGAVLRGVAHVASVKNVRTISFAEELGYVPQGMLPLLKHQKEDAP